MQIDIECPVRRLPLLRDVIMAVFYHGVSIVKAILVSRKLRVVAQSSVAVRTQCLIVSTPRWKVLGTSISCLGLRFCRSCFDIPHNASARMSSPPMVRA